jgi:hypothetical protein
MKNFRIKLFLAIFTGLLFLSSCEEDRLDLLPPFEDILEDSVDEVDDLRALLNGSYDQFSSATLFGASLLINSDIMSDNVFVSSTNDGYFVGVNNLTITQQTNFGYLSFYGAIRNANFVLNYEQLLAPGVSTADFDQEQVALLQAEAKIIRGLSLFYLVELYSSTPTSGQYQEYGVPVYTTIYNPSDRFPRSTVSEVYDQIISDLEAGATAGPAVPANKGFLSQTAAKLLLSRVYLTRGQSGDYQKAVDYANEVINNSPGGNSGFGFVSADDYVNYFSSTDNDVSENQPETVWEINMTSGDNPGVNSALGAFYPRTGSHKSLLFRQEFADLFAGTNDVRGELLTNTGAPSTDDPKGYWTNKWPRSTAEGNFTINPKILRMSEAKLNKIEALYKLGQTAEALTLLNDFAATRDEDPYSSISIDTILLERRKEFFAEGYRFFDLKRNNMGYSKNTNCTGTVCTVEAGSKYFVIPMPLNDEILINPEMTQHPLWQ